MKQLSDKQLIKWFNTKGDFCPYCGDELDFQCQYASDKTNPTTDYTSYCSCDNNLAWMVTIDNSSDKTIAVQRVC